ncbi:TPA: phospholipid carrier-dependent glycosyltransferase [Patescibacteria group bacterium]|nr:MAG: hypothetical protein UT71_C0023G0004 [Parcubacteria group bacterium GW2011_GWF2_40_10]KKR47708.1 MAG: hypothetical protein UT83_C0005G0025 [Parcubacteria group bacterium GW2011_GWA2_40_143]KKR60038.1 MAG: hypothetical protein UT97_C0006G0005 [Parcubacteria group bacterium GW2011_GWC2_40_31]KKR75932.1 MAG: hypothetical protein UU20_C0038G0004 [Parcubacteria group bacterium GW2011_GWE2_40_8]KKR81412.1 MAG: hypothetical protein UU28_C0025G0004 [Parcubacteria group bacterium GW2011_GWD2_40_
MVSIFKKLFSKKRNILIFYSVIVLAFSYFSYFKNYDYPPAVFWDENYHIASAQKYLTGVMFMETHPPLGKLVIALGEYLIHPNDAINKSEFTKTDYIKDFPAGYSFAGVRFFSALFAWLSAIVFFYIFYFISKNPHTSLIFSSFYIFENALITHSRAAMLEGSHLFFILLAILYFVYLVQKPSRKTLLNYLILGILVGLTISIKATGAITVFLFPFLFVWDWKYQGLTLILRKGLFFAVGSITIFSLVWYIHFSLGKTVADDKFYKASEEYKEIMTKGLTSDPKYFPTMLKDNFAYMANYNKGVPKLDVCKPDENGSYPLAWLVGDKSINYRWEKSGDGVRYMYLQVNPITWFLSLAGIILSLILIIGRVVFKTPIKNKNLFYLITTFATLYVIYMAIMLHIERVMYLYHYFIPLIFSFVLAFLIFNYIFEGKIANKSKKLYISLIIMVVIIAGTYKFFSPLSYYQPLTTEQFEKRIWFDFWKLKPIE